MNGRTTVIARREADRNPRGTLHMGARGWRLPSPEWIAGGGVLALASVVLIGPLGVLLFMACSAAVMAANPLFNLRQLLRFAPLLVLPVLAILSTIWSDAPQRSMRAGLELLLTVVATILLCRNLRAERLILALFIAFLVTALTVVPGIPASLSSKLPLAAPWGSKNSVGFTGYMLFALSLALIVDRRQHWIFRVMGIGAVGFALVVAMLAQSGGTTASIAITLAVFPPLALLGAFKMPVRIALIVFTALLLLICTAFLDDIASAVTDFRTDVLHKDATLTGRTYLWDFAYRLSSARPALGYGYSAFWRQGNIDAEGLWRWGGIASRAGFNFHNAFIEMRVDLGLVGLTLMVLTCVAIAVVGVARQITAPSVAMAALLAMTAVNYVRSYAEDGLIAPFSLIMLIWLATGLYAFKVVGGSTFSWDLLTSFREDRVQERETTNSPRAVSRRPRQTPGRRGLRPLHPES